MTVEEFKKKISTAYWETDFYTFCEVVLDEQPHENSRLQMNEYRNFQAMGKAFSRMSKKRLVEITKLFEMRD